MEEAIQAASRWVWQVRYFDDKVYRRRRAEDRYRDAIERSDVAEKPTRSVAYKALVELEGLGSRRKKGESDVEDSTRARELAEKELRPHVDRVTEDLRIYLSNGVKAERELKQLRLSEKNLTARCEK